MQWLVPYSSSTVAQLEHRSKHGWAWKVVDARWCDGKGNPRLTFASEGGEWWVTVAQLEHRSEYGWA